MDIDKSELELFLEYCCEVGLVKKLPSLNYKSIVDQFIIDNDKYNNKDVDTDLICEKCGKFKKKVIADVCNSCGTVILGY